MRLTRQADTAMQAENLRSTRKLQSFYISVTCSNRASGTFMCGPLGRAVPCCYRARVELGVYVPRTCHSGFLGGCGFPAKP
jgi:hypothetical protein